VATRPRATRYFYQPDGRVGRAGGDGGLLNVTLDHDLEARATTVTDAMGDATVSYWNERPHSVRVTDPLGCETRTERDPFGQVLTFTDPLGRTTRVTRDESGDATACQRRTAAR
jgi:YD repeat-containing protein